MVMIIKTLSYIYLESGIVCMISTFPLNTIFVTPQTVMSFLATLQIFIGQSFPIVRGTVKSQCTCVGAVSDFLCTCPQALEMAFIESLLLGTPVKLNIFIYLYRHIKRLLSLAPPYFFLIRYMLSCMSTPTCIGNNSLGIQFIKSQNIKFNTICK